MASREKNFASAVIYVHKAENRIAQFLNAVITTMEDNFEHSEIICVNDSSDDGSLHVIIETSKKASTTSVSVVNMSYYHGLELEMGKTEEIAIIENALEYVRHVYG